MSTNKNNLIIIDGSYYCFYRFHALSIWWKRSHENEAITDPINNEEFVEKFDKLFIEKINEIPKKLKINKENNKIIVAKDCPRSDIWRNEFLESYKGTRDNSNFEGGLFFKRAYDKLFNDSNTSQILFNHKLEADDCIALTVKYYMQNINDYNIYIIGNDMDYLQLLQNDNIHFYNLKYQNLRNNKSFIDNSADKSLFCKILIGDKSDNLKPIINKCGIKTAINYYNKKDTFDDLLAKNKNCKDKYEQNRKLIDFNYIPSHLCDEFYNNNLQKIL